jgi:hypothetical protein
MKRINIKNCGECLCFHYIVGSYPPYPHCTYSDRDIPENGKVPSWCKLREDCVQLSLSVICVCDDMVRGNSDDERNM